MGHKPFGVGATDAADAGYAYAHVKSFRLAIGRPAADGGS